MILEDLRTLHRWSYHGEILINEAVQDGLKILHEINPTKFMDMSNENLYPILHDWMWTKFFKRRYQGGYEEKLNNISYKS
jgi:hypothetical protein